MPMMPKNADFAPRSTQTTISDLKGVDLSSAPANVAEYRSPCAPNMMPDLSGKPVKRTGWHTVERFPARINGIFRFTAGGAVKTLVHAGTVLYDGDALHPAGTGLSNSISLAWELAGKLWIADGQSFMVYGLFPDPLNEGESSWQLLPVKDVAYCPTITISRDPDGGGAPYEPLNLIGSAFTEEFLGKAYATEYQLSYSGLDADEVTAEVLSPSSTAGNKVWNRLEEGTGFSVDRTNGKVTFASAPGVSPIAGEDNVRITARKTVAEYRARIDQSAAGALFGVAGARDRLFLTGCPELPQCDWYCQLGDPTYWGENWYCELGGASRIVGYSSFGGYLAAHLAGEEGGRVVLRGGELYNGEASFPVVNSLEGPAAVSRRGFGTLGGEPLFLTGRGVYALTAQDVTGDKYIQRRSYFIDKALQSLASPAEAFCAVWRDFFLIAAGGRVYLMDGAQKTYASGAPYSTHQYECYYWEGVPARAFAVIGGALAFGTADGGLCEFYADAEAPGSYSDDGEPITAWWDLPDFTGRRFFENKALTYIAVKLAGAPRTSVTVQARIGGVWKELWSESARFRYLMWSELSWPHFTWDSDPSARSCGRRRLTPRFPAALLRLSNARVNEPFGLYGVGLQFSESGKYRP